MFKHVLIPTDGSALSMKAVKSAVAFAKATGAKITVLTVIEPSGVLGTDSKRVAATRKAYEQHAKDIAGRELKDAEREAKKQGVPCVTILQEQEQPYQAIVETATRKRCDLIAMASHGRSGVAALVLGSVASKVLAYSRVPVLVYRFAT
jgi:nucleotide-binding universal stress UspA family protein